MICISFPCEYEAFSSTPLRVEKKIMDESDGTHGDFQVATEG